MYKLLMLRTQIYLPADQIRNLKRIAVEEDISLSLVIRKMIGDKLQEKKLDLKKNNCGKWLLSLGKKAEELKIKGPKDLATNLDKYLYGDK